VSEADNINEIYVVGSLIPTQPDYKRLLGLITLRQLVLARPDQTAAEIMVADYVVVDVETDQERAAEMMQHYDFLSMPVLDHKGQLAGVLTIDDVLDVIRDEQTEDVLRMGAVVTTDKPYLAIGVWNSVRRRIGWLLLLFVAESFTGSVLRHFEEALEAMVMLAFFIPLIIDSAGNAGSQTSATIIRSLALGEVRLRDWLRVFWRETRVGILLGTALGLIGFLRAILWNTGPGLALVVGITLVVVVVMANAIGSTLPLLAKRMGTDPAVVSGPLITTLADAAGLFFYFSIARLILGI
jgi:magnesium transporter